ncbi:MAG TPA: response regulator transcription factor [Thermodesulfobacteriota bacterium]|nr:response regulator transcription factor [Thermodesulfobacteriota bacterium]
MKEEKPIIFVVDDDPSVRESTQLMLEGVGFNVKTFPSARDFLNAKLQEGLGCLILDVRMPGISGLDLQEKLVSAKSPLPVIFITGHGTVPMSVRAMKAGAVDFLQKPFEEQDLLDGINRAITRQREERSKKDEADNLQQRLKALTPREYEVFSLLVTGMANKEIAYKLGTSERTVKAHRAQIMEKMNARSFADLVRFAEKLKTHPQNI